MTVVYALPQELFQEALELRPGSRVRDALAQSGVLEAFPDIEVESAPLGIFPVGWNSTRRLRMAIGLRFIVRSS